jgi:hypothetical protein
MTIKEWAEKLNGIEYPADEPDEENGNLKTDGIIAVYGASDDLMEFRGVIYDEVGAYEGGEAFIASRGKGTAFLFDEEENRDSAEFNQDEIKKMEKVVAIWAPEDIEASWKIEIDLPHETFDIMKDGKLFCRGVLILVDNIKTVR